LYNKYITKKVLGGFVQFKIIHTVKYADDVVLLVKEEAVLQGMIDTLVEI